MLTVPGIAHATDVAAVMAALPNAEAECRYLKTLCDKYEADFQAMSEFATAHNYRDWRFGFPMINAKKSAIQSAEDVLRAKHDTLPKCYKACPIKETPEP